MVFYDLLVLLIFVWFSRKLFQFIKFPPLFGEVFAGVLAGPLILGVVHETEAIMILAELGIFFLMFHSGLEANPADLKRSSKRAIAVAFGGVLIPFVGGTALSFWYGYDIVASLFVGLVLSVTAVAISARLFKDLKISGTQVAHVSLTAAIITEVMMLIVLSVLLDVSQTGILSFDHLIFLVLKFVAYFSVVFFVGEKIFPFLYRVLYKGNKGFTFSIILALAFGVIAEYIGLHMIIGAFLAGLFLRQELLEQSVFDKIEDRVFGLSYSFLGPIFFATLAFHLNVTALSGNWWFIFLLFLIAIFGKVVGSGYAAQLSGMNSCQSLGVGIAMNGRGAVDLIIIALGYQKGIIGPELFSILVIITFISTLISIVALKPLSPAIKGEYCEMSIRDRLKMIVT